MSELPRIKYVHRRFPLVAWRALGQPRKGKPALEFLPVYQRKRPKFYPAPVGGTTTARFSSVSTGTFHRLTSSIYGQSVCSLSDGFCYETGRKIALDRLEQALLAKAEEGLRAASIDGIDKARSELAALLDVIRKERLKGEGPKEDAGI